MKKIIISALCALIMGNSLFCAIVSGSSSSDETAISIMEVLTDNANHTVTVTGQINNPAEDQQVTLMVYKRGSDYKDINNILFIDQTKAVLDTDNQFTITFPYDAGITENTLSLRMGGSNIKTPATFHFYLSEIYNKYNKLFKNENDFDYTLTEGSSGEYYITGNFKAGVTVEDLNLADGVEVYNDSTKITGELGTGMVIKKDDVFVTIVIIGDLTCNGKVSIEDAKYFLEYLVGNKTFTPAQILALGDIAKENDSNIKKLRNFLNFLVKKGGVK